MRNRRWLLAMVAAGLLAACGSDGDDGVEGAPGEDGSSCSVEDVAEGARIHCDDGTEVIVEQDIRERCDIDEVGGETVIRCGDEEVVVDAGQECEVTSQGDRIEIVCDDGSTGELFPEARGVLARLAGSQAGGYSDGSGTQTRFDGPMSLSMASGDFLYFTDAFNQTIRRYGLNSDQTITLAGKPGVEGIETGVGSDARFEGPRSIVVDPDEEYAYIGDGFNCVVRRLDLNTTEVESFAGEAEFCDGVDGAIGNARFGLIIGMAIDETGDYLYVSDRGNDAIRRIDLQEEEVETIAGQLGDSGLEDGPGDDARFNSPGGISFDASGDYLYIADMSNDVIRRMATYGDYDTVTVAGEPVDGFADDIEDGPGDEATFSTPQTVIRLGDDLYVFGFSNTIRRITEDDGNYGVETVAGAFNAQGFVDGSLEEARFGVGFAGVAVPGTSSIMIGDLSNDAIREVNFEDETVTTVVGPTPDIVGYEEGVGADARFDSPAGLATTGDGAVSFVADAGNHAIRYVERETGRTGLVAGLAGSAGMADGLFDAARFDTPRALRLSDDESSLYVLDRGNSAIREIELDTGFVSTVLDGGDFMESPQDMVMANGDIYITDAAEQVIWHYDGDELAVLAGGLEYDEDDDDMEFDGVGEDALFAEPVGLAIDADQETLYVTDGDVFQGPQVQGIRAVDIATGEVTTVFGGNIGGVGDQGDVEGFDTAALRWAEHLEVLDGGDRLMVADTWHNAIRLVDLSEEEVHTVVGIVGVNGAANEMSVPLEEARLERPIGLRSVDEWTWVTTFDNAVYEVRFDEGGLP